MLKSSAALAVAIALFAPAALAEGSGIQVYGKVTRYFERLEARGNVTYVSLKKCGPQICVAHVGWYSIDGRTVEACRVWHQRVHCNQRRFIEPWQIEAGNYVPPESIGPGWDAGDETTTPDTPGDEPVTLNGQPVS